jgi:uncharacterized protein
MDRLTESLIHMMAEYYAGDPKRIQHFIKVYTFADFISSEENLNGYDKFITVTAAIVHDIGIKESETKYGKSDGKLQEKEGPSLAENMLRQLNFDSPAISRVSYLVGHHHTYDNIEGMDYQILVESDFLVNMFEDNMSNDAIRSAYKLIFKTSSGKSLCRTMYSASFPQEDL